MICEWAFLVLVLVRKASPLKVMSILLSKKRKGDRRLLRKTIQILEIRHKMTACLCKVIPKLYFTALAPLQQGFISFSSRTYLHLIYYLPIIQAKTALTVSLIDSRSLSSRDANDFCLVQN